jgi:UDPglucose 6-dehydrogenase
METVEGRDTALVERKVAEVMDKERLAWETGKSVGMVGLGYVGIATAVALAQHGRSVKCYERDREKARRMRDGNVPIFEPGIEELFGGCITTGSITLCQSLAEVLLDCQVVFVAVGTPPASDGSPDLSYVDQVATEMAGVLQPGHLIVLKSTVPPDTYKRVRLTIKHERARMQLPPVDFDVAVNPEFLREGQAVKDSLFPERIVVGVDSDRAAAVLRNVYAPFGSPIVLMDPVSAMLVKYASNCFLATKISFINEMARICELAGGDVGEVARGMGMDTRIGQQFLRAGLGYGGSCFPKDTAGLLSIGRSLGYEPEVVKAAISVNAQQYVVAIDKLVRLVGQLRGASVAVLGLAFKSDTDDTRESVSLKLISGLLEAGAVVRAHDYRAIENVRRELTDVAFFADPYGAVAGCDALVIATEWTDYRQLDWTRIKQLMRGDVVVDGRNLLGGSRLVELGFRYEGIGLLAHNEEGSLRSSHD